MKRKTLKNTDLAVVPLCGLAPQLAPTAFESARVKSIDSTFLPLRATARSLAHMVKDLGKVGEVEANATRPPY